MHETTDAGVGPALGDAGVCPTITFKDKSWTLGHPTQKAKAALELLVIETVQANLDRAKPALRPGKYEAKCEELDEAIYGGHYKTGGKLWNTVNNGPDGQALFLTSLLRERHGEATLADGLTLWRNVPRQVRRALAVVVPDFFALLAEDLPLEPEERLHRQAEMTLAFLEALSSLSPEPSTESSSNGSTPA